MDAKSRSSLASLSVAAHAMLALLLGLGAPMAQADVGTISFVIGRVQVLAASGQTRTAAAGDPIRSGDTIITSAGEHAHLRFVDGGFVSVRPGSRLSIEQYDTDPADTAIRFRLEHGVVRSITGEAAQAHKERFRLNTPVAAIGVRGTDFVVQTGLDEVRAVVNQGAIVVAPFAATCTQHSLGPCATADARELADHMGRVLLELTSMQPARIRPIGLGGPDQVTPPSPQEPAAERPAVTAVESAGADRALKPARGTETPIAPILPAEPAIPAPPPEVIVPAVPKQPLASLRWGRWAGNAREGDAHSVSYQTASAAGAITVGDRYAGLFRTPGSSPVLSTQLGQASFSLSSGELTLIASTGAPSPGKIETGRLDIDFAQRSFATALSLSHPSTGRVGLEVSGAVRDDGIFAVRSGNSRVAGAVSLDGKEAGYLFEKVVDQGTLTGTTLWTR